MRTHGITTGLGKMIELVIQPNGGGDAFLYDTKLDRETHEALTDALRRELHMTIDELYAEFDSETSTPKFASKYALSVQDWRRISIEIGNQLGQQVELVERESPRNLED